MVVYRNIALLAALGGLLASCATPRPPVWTPLPATMIDRPLSLEECVAIAEKNDIHSALWKSRMDQASSELTTARTLPNPSFGVSWEDLGLRDAGDALSNITYGFTYPIFFWVTHGKEVEVAQRKLEAERAGVLADRRDLAIEVGNAYFGILAAKRQERATESLLAQALAGQTLAEESLKLGATSGHEVDSARADALQAEADLFDIRQTLRRERVALAFALGVDRPIEVDVQDAEVTMPADLPQTSPEAPMPDSLLGTALAADPAYASATSNRLAAESAFQLEARRAIPFTGTQAGGAIKDAPEGIGHNLMLDTEIPVFNWNRGGIKRARADLLAAQANEETARRSVVEKLSLAWQAYCAAHTRYETFSAKLADDRRRIAADAQELFAAGEIEYRDLIQARTQWQESELAGAEAWQASVNAAWELKCRLDATTYDRADGAVAAN